MQSDPRSPTSPPALADILRDHAATADQFFLSGAPREALARTRQALRMHAESEASSADADEIVRMLRQRAPVYRRAITRREEATARRASMRALREGGPEHAALRTPGLASAATATPGAEATS